MSNNHLKAFLEDRYTNYSVYKVLQRIPHALDTLANTQRKLIQVLSELPRSRKLKTAETYGLIYNKMKYRHGDASAFNTSESMSRSATNNINIFTEEGNFGTRTDKTAGGPRYTNTRFSDAARLIFRNEDKPLLTPQYFEGAEIEPEHFLPIIPIMLINGNSAIANGFASSFLPRHPLSIIDSSIEFLRTQNMSEIEVAFPYFKGSIVKGENNGSYEILGCFTRAKRNSIEVTEIPPNYTRESYIKKLKKLQEKGIIKSFTERCIENEFFFNIRFTENPKSLTDEEIINTLGLRDKIQENFTFIYPNSSFDPIMTFETAEEYLEFFLTQRLPWYQKRIDYEIMKIEEELTILENRIHFIDLVNSGEIIVNKKKIDLIKDLKEKEILEIDGSFDYLLNMRIWNLTPEKIKEFRSKSTELKKLLKVKKRQKPVELFCTELLEIKEFVQDELKEKGLI